MKTIKGDLKLTKDTAFNESIEVRGNITGYYNLKVNGNISALNIDAHSIDAWDIHALNIDAFDIDAWNINAWNIDAWNINAQDMIYCEKIILKEDGKIKARILIQNRLKFKRKEWKNE